MMSRADVMAALRADPKNPRHWLALGHIMAREGDVAKARDCFQRALTLDPDALDARLGLMALDDLAAPPVVESVAEEPLPAVESVAAEPPTSEREVAEAPTVSGGAAVFSSDAVAAPAPVEPPDPVLVEPPDPVPAAAPVRRSSLLPILVAVAGLALLGALGWFVMRQLGAMAQPPATLVAVSEAQPRGPTSSLPATWTPKAAETTATTRPTRTPQATGTALPPTATPPGAAITDADFVAGKEAFARQDGEAVVAAMSRFIERDATQAPAFWYRGMGYALLNRYEEMLADMDQAITLDPRYALAYADRGMAQYALTHGDEAEADWTQALSLDPTLAKVHEYRAIAYMAAEQYGPAAEAYRAALAIDPARGSAWEGLAYGQSLREEYDNCVRNATLGIQAQADYERLYLTRGNCYGALGAYDKALADLTHYVEAAPTNPDGWLGLGSLQFARRSFDEAAASLTTAIELAPDRMDAVLLRGQSHLKREAYDEALADFESVLQNEESATALAGRARARVGLGQVMEALSDYQLAITLHREPSAYAGLAELYLSREQFQQALDLVNEGIMEASAAGITHPAMLAMRGRAYLGLGEYGGAENDLTQAYALDPDPARLYYLGLVYQAVGRNAEAAEALDQFVAYPYADAQLVADARRRLATLP